MTASMIEICETSNLHRVSNTFLVPFSNKMLEFTKYLSEKQTGKTLIRLLLQKQSDLVIHCLARPVWQATSVLNFRTFTINLKINSGQILIV